MYIHKRVGMVGHNVQNNKKAERVKRGANPTDACNDSRACVSSGMRLRSSVAK